MRMRMKAAGSATSNSSSDIDSGSPADAWNCLKKWVGVLRGSVFYQLILTLRKVLLSFTTSLKTNTPRGGPPPKWVITVISGNHILTTRHMFRHLGIFWQVQLYNFKGEEN